MRHLIVPLWASLMAMSGLHAEDRVGASVPEEPHKWLSFSGFADVETAYLCRGFVWDRHPFSSQYADGTIDFGTFGRFSGYAWSMLSWSPASHVCDIHYRFSEIDYGLRYAFDLGAAIIL